MSTATIVVPQGLGYAAGSILSLTFLLAWQTAIVGRKRGKAGIKYPQLYAEKAQVEASKDALIFNCAQRAHANTLEWMPMILSTTLITSIKYPIPAAAACGIWTFSRIFYTLGYTTGEPKKRSRGGIGYIGGIGLLLGSCYTVFELIMSGI